MLGGVAGLLLVVGLAMNVVGVALSSLRDLAGLWGALAQRLRHYQQRTVARLRATWRRLRGIQPQVHYVSGSSGVSVGVSSDAGGITVWNAMSDDLDAEEAIRRLRTRTDSLSERVSIERSQRLEEVARLRERASDLEQEMKLQAQALHIRIDDIDVKPAGQRATGALLVICGSILMFLGGLMSAGVS